MIDPNRPLDSIMGLVAAGLAALLALGLWQWLAAMAK